MSEHKHEWQILGAIPDKGFGTEAECKICLAKINWKEIEHRLNATECLSAKDATLAGNAVNGNKYWGGKPIMSAIEEFNLREKLWAFANKLEGKD